MKKTNYKMGALKRSLKVRVRGQIEPGTLITSANARKMTTGKQLKAMPSKERVAIMGMV